MRKFICFYQIPCLLLLFFLFKFGFSLSSSPPLNCSSPLCLPKECSLLLQFKNTISLDTYSICDPSTSSSKINSWVESTNCCAWDGVNCDKATGHVIGLDLSCSGLVGTLPANTSLFLLPRLQKLNLAHNYLDGSISSILFNRLVSLAHLNFSYCSFSGLVPSEISFLSNLVSLDLSYNAYLTFDNHSFGLLAHNLSNLRDLVLDLTDMSHVALTSFLNLTSSLEFLSLHSCQLDGKFPSGIFQLPHLDYLSLQSNQNLTGYLPESSWKSPLSFMDLSYCSFKGLIHASLGNLTKLTFLDLSRNNFEGQIPDVFSNLNQLSVLHSQACNFSGQLPTSIFNLIDLRLLDLSNNGLTGQLPAHVSGIQNLEKLNLSNNLISGEVPSWLFGLPSLQTLDLNNNELTSSIEEIPKPNSIKVLLLAHNHIHGPIPSSLFDLVNLTNLDLSSNKLSGVIKIDMLSKLVSLENLDLSNNSLLSMSDIGNDVNYTVQKLQTMSFSSCNVNQFPNFLRTMRSLSYLDLSNNKISGTIVKWESDGWEQLQFLNLSYNLLTSLEQFPGNNLRILDLRSNLLQGPLLAPPPLLKKLYISRNKLTGKLPPFICNMSSLFVLDLSRNNLTGIIPACLVNSSKPLSTLNLQMNNFHGRIPSFESESLQNLALNDNRLEGRIPRSLLNCVSLVLLNLANNNLNDTFPYWLGTLSELRYLILQGNGFHGRLQNLATNSSFSQLQIIDLSQNDFTGDLPSNFFLSLAANKVISPLKLICDEANSCRPAEYHNPLKVTMKRLQLELEEGKILPSFTMVDFSNNQFNGGIPQALGELVSLHLLNLSCNNLTGSIPPSMGNMKALESLDLSSNKLHGRIPLELIDLTFLEVLNLSQNHLDGPIPVGNQFNTFENDSYYGNPRLCGFPLTKKCLNITEPPPSTFVDRNDSGIPFIWKVVMMGYGCGMVLGLSMGYIVFITGRPWWFVKIVERDWQKNVNMWIQIIRQGRK